MTIFAPVLGATSATLADSGLTPLTGYSYYRQATDDLTSGVSNTVSLTTTAASGYADETDTLISRMTTPPTSARALIMDALIRGLIADGVWTLLDRLWVSAAADSQAAALNWKAPATDALTATSTTFTADQGFTGNGTNAFLTSATNLSAMAQFAQASSSLFFWNVNGAGSGSGDLGQAFASSFLLYMGVGGSVGVQLGATFITPATAARTGLLVASQDGATLSTDVNGAALSSVANTTSAPPVRPLTILKVNGAFSTAQVGCVGLGAHLNATKRLALYTRLRTYMTAVGVP